MYHLISCLPYISSHKKFLIATVLLQNCEPAYRRAYTYLAQLIEDAGKADIFDDLHSKANDVGMFYGSHELII